MVENFMTSHRFYNWSLGKQKRFIAGVYLVIFFLFLVFISLVIVLKIFWPLFIFPFLVTIGASFADAPSGKLSGNLIYYSPFFIATKIRKGRSIIHAGTPFDYFFVFKKEDRGRKAQKEVLTQFLAGMVRFIDHLPEEEIIIEGTSYFFNERTAKKLGFEIKPAGLDQMLILGFNIIPLALTYSFTQGKLSFPTLNRVRKVTISSVELRQQRGKILALQQRLARMG